LLARRGATVKTLDLLIATYALAQGVEVLTTDADFRIIAKGGRRARPGLTSGPGASSGSAAVAI